MRKTAKLVEEKICDLIAKRKNQIAKKWGIDTSNGTCQREPKSRIYKKWQAEGKLEEYLKAFEVYQELLEILETIDYGDLYEEAA